LPRVLRDAPLVSSVTGGSPGAVRAAAIGRLDHEPFEEAPLGVPSPTSMASKGYQYHVGGATHADAPGSYQPCYNRSLTNRGFGILFEELPIWVPPRTNSLPPRPLHPCGRVVSQTVEGHHHILGKGVEVKSKTSEPRSTPQSS
jgi:hypothetical protein